MQKHCPCGSNEAYMDCCGAFITGERIPTTPEQLMRSRYTAYTQANVDYIAHTMKPPASDGFNPNTARQWAKQVKWLKLEVLNASSDGTKGFVEFRAHYSHNHQQHVIHENSEFQLEKGRWYYVNGSLQPQ